MNEIPEDHMIDIVMDVAMDNMLHLMLDNPMYLWKDTPDIEAIDRLVQYGEDNGFVISPMNDVYGDICRTKAYYMFWIANESKKILCGN